jgi:hypothetical protein
MWGHTARKESPFNTGGERGLKMSQNPITGEAQVEIQGKQYILRFDWEAIAAINAVHGDGPNMFDPVVLASVAAIGMKKYHPEMTAERIRELSPPLISFAAAVQQALQWAYFGAEKPPEADEKKSPKKTGWWRRIRRHARTGSIPEPSGS